MRQSCRIVVFNAIVYFSKMEKKKLNIVSPVFNEEGNIESFFKKLLPVKKVLEDKYEINIIFVDDGSRDKSSTIIEKIEKDNNSVKALYFTRNFGHQNAIVAGLKEYQADFYLVMDSDLQQDPDLIETMIQNMESSKCEIVQMEKKYTDYENIFKRNFSKIFYSLFSKLTNIQIHKGSSDFFLISHRVREEIINSKISYNFLRGFLHWTGFKKLFISYIPDKRMDGRSGYSYLKKFEFALTGIYFYTTKLYLFLFIISIIVMILCILYTLYIFVEYFRGNLAQYAGWSTITILILFFGSCSFLMNSVILFILNKIFDFSSKKPMYLKKK